MSHTTKIRSMAIRDIKALRKATKNLQKRGINCSLIEKAKPRMYFRNQGDVCDHVLKLEDGKYDVGFEKGEDGSYYPVYDEWDGHVSKQLGAKCPMPEGADAETRAQHGIGQFWQEYNKEASMNEAMKQGMFDGGVTVDADGNMHLHIGVPS